MCGIAFGFSKRGKKINKSIMKRYNNQKHRGTEGFGYVAIYKDRINVGRHTEEAGIRDQIMKETSAMIMFHHRNPTSTPNIVEATHPIRVTHDELEHDYYIVHNGVIRNADELKKKHEKLGYSYDTVIENETISHYTAKKTKSKYFNTVSKTEKFNDSESLAIEVARVIDGMSSKIDCVGTIAFVAQKFEKGTERLLSVSFGHNSGNPLTITENNDHFFLTSLGGKAIPEDVMYTLHTHGEKIGHTDEREINIGYMTEHQRNGGTTYSSNYNTVKQVPARTESNYKDTPKGRTITVGNEIDKNTEEYFQDKYGYNPAKRLEWDKEDTTRKEKMGFNTNQDTVDTTETDVDFEKKSEGYVIMYIEKEEAFEQVKADIDTAEWMLQDSKMDSRARLQLQSEIAKYESFMEDVVGEMNAIEDAYYDDLGEAVEFKKLVEAHKEQQDDIQFEEMGEAIREAKENASQVA